MPFVFMLQEMRAARSVAQNIRQNAEIRVLGKFLKRETSTDRAVGQWQFDNRLLGRIFWKDEEFPCPFRALRNTIYPGEAKTEHALVLASHNQVKAKISIS